MRVKINELEKKRYKNTYGVAFIGGIENEMGAINIGKTHIDKEKVS